MARTGYAAESELVTGQACSVTNIVLDGFPVQVSPWEDGGP